MTHRYNTAIGVIYQPGNYPTDASWTIAAGAYAKIAEDNFGIRPDQVVFQSWTDKPDYALPETGAGTFTSLLHSYFLDRSKLGWNTGGGDNLAYGKQATSSGEVAGSPANAALDSDPATAWISGGFAPQWIQIDLGAPHTIYGFDLLTTQTPAGHTTHNIYGSASGNAANWKLLGTISQQSENWQVLYYFLPQKVD